MADEIYAAVCRVLAEAPAATRGDTMTQLVKYDAACRALAEAVTADEVKHVRDVAMAMRLYAKQAKNKDLEADAYELRVRAERRLGEVIAEQKATVGLNVGGRPSKTGTAEEPVSKPGTLAEAGIDKKLSSKAQKISAIPPAAFEEMVAEGREEVQRSVERRTIKAVEIAEARAGYVERAEVGGTVEDLHKLAASGKRFAVIYADPPWDFTTYSDAGKGRSAEMHYGVMSLDAIKALPVEALAADDAVLLLWATWPNLLDAIALIEAWGFRYKTAGFVWVKTCGNGNLHTGLGYHTRANSEQVLLATRGNPQRLAMDVHQIVMAPVGEHSAKPGEVHDRIERLLAGPYLELFARAERERWDTWGNEIAPPQVATITLLTPTGRMKWLAIEKQEADMEAPWWPPGTSVLAQLKQLGRKSE
jgi:N6-adenosine-specific RNA methylase IME4